MQSTVINVRTYAYYIMCKVHVCQTFANCVLTGPPGDIIDVIISPNTITACSLVVQWSKPSSDPVCGSVWYTVTISTEGGILITTDNTTVTNYNITGLNDNTVYHVNVTASNNAGSSSTTTRMMNSSSGKFIICMHL